MTAPLASVVVPTRNRSGKLAALLSALAAQDYPRYEVIVVDDASTDGTTQTLAAWQGEGRISLRHDRPFGSYAARNRGWEAAQGEIVAFTDDDCLPEPGWLSALVAALRSSPTAVGAQGMTLARPGSPTPFTHQIEQRRGGPPYRTCNVAYRRSTLERLGGFDGSLRWYADNIFGLRAKQEGEIIFAPAAVVNHPPRERVWRDRAAWRARFAADAAHRRALRGLGVERVKVPGRALPIVLWLLRPLLKQAGAHLRYLLAHPRDYLRQAPAMAREKWELLLALRSPLTPNPSPPGGEGLTASVPVAFLLVSMVVVTRDRPHLLRGTLDALAAQSWEPREVVVVDNGGDGATAALCREYALRLVPAAGRTLGAARQAGVEAARGAIIAFTDDDCLPDRRWLEELVRALQVDPSLRGVQGRTETEPGSLLAHGVRVSRGGHLFETCNMAYRREALEEAGGFDPAYRGWFEDTALGAEVLRRGRIGFAPAALVVHRSVARPAMDRKRWRVLLEDERRLARGHPAFYRRTRGPGFLPAVTMHWLVGSPLKRIARALPRAWREPREFAALLRTLLWERRELIAALRDERSADQR